MFRRLTVAVLGLALLCGMPPKLYAEESLLKEIEEGAERVEKRLAENDVPCGWWYFENGVRRYSAGSEINDPEARGKPGYYQCQGGCSQSGCAATESKDRPGVWVCRCR